MGLETEVPVSVSRLAPTFCKEGARGLIFTTRRHGQTGVSGDPV